MTNKFKERVRARMDREKISYSEALRREKGPPSSSAQPPKTPTYWERCIRAWSPVVESLANGRAVTEWRDAAEIAQVLGGVVQRAPDHHVLLPSGGGIDVEKVQRSHERGCIELVHGRSVCLMKPTLLRLVLPAKDPTREWAYFWLDTATLAPSGASSTTRDHEELAEIEPGEYLDRSHWDSGVIGADEDGEEVPLPEDARLVSRWFRGSFMFVVRSGGYNAIDRYRGDHNVVGESMIRQIIEDGIEQLHDLGKYGVDLSR